MAAGDWWDKAGGNASTAAFKQPDPFNPYSLAELPAQETPGALGLGGTGITATDITAGGGTPQIGGWDKFFGSKEYGPGWGKTAAGIGLGAGQLWLGKEQLGVAKDTLAAQKQQFADQFNVQKQQVNRDIYDQGRARYAAGETGALTPDEYLKQNRIQ